MTHTSPRFLYVHVNQRCNLRCMHCDFWRRDDNDRAHYLSWDRKRDILTEFSALSPSGRVVVCGGESMLDLKDYFAISEHCRHLGLRCLSVVNGTRVADSAIAHRIIQSGPHEISISLNSHLEAEHDRTRGRTGAFRRAVTAVRLLLQARKDLEARDSRVYVMGLIHGHNFRSLDSFYDFVLNDLRADKLKLNFLQPSFGCNSVLDLFFSAHHQIDSAELLDILAQCDKKYRLHLNPAWLRQVAVYCESLNKATDAEMGWKAQSSTSEHLCNTYDRNIMVDLYGVARLCFSTRFPGVILRTEGDLTNFWRAADPLREIMSKCNCFCGISHSVRSESSTLSD